MSPEVMPEQRSAVMILVDVSWEEPNGTLQTIRARMENKSSTGVCVRVNTDIEVGARIRIQSPWEEFYGVVRYCRRDAKVFLVGIQRDSEEGAIPERPGPVPVPKQVLKDAPLRDNARGEAPVAPGARIGSVVTQPKFKPREIPAGARKVERVTSHVAQGVSVSRKSERDEDARIESPTLGSTGGNTTGATGARMASEMHVIGIVPETPAWTSRDTLQYQEFDVRRWMELQTKQLADVPQVKIRAREAGRGRERNFMQRKWLDVGSWGDKQDAAAENGGENSSGSGPGNSSGSNSSAGEKGKSASSVTPPFAKDKVRAAAPTADDTGYQGELLPLEDIYRAAGIMIPRGGYSIVKITEMLHSEHIRGLAKDMKRASVMMALDAAGVPINEVLRDAKVRLEAIDAYEADQRKLCEAEWARKEEENLQIRAELERVKAQYIARINRNLEAVAREKARFTSWQTTNQQEAQNISDAAELCLKPAAAAQPLPAPALTPGPATTSTPSPTTSQAEAAIKVV